jgi:hypothetical protein
MYFFVIILFVLDNSSVSLGPTSSEFLLMCKNSGPLETNFKILGLLYGYTVSIFIFSYNIYINLTSPYGCKLSKNVNVMTWGFLFFIIVVSFIAIYFGVGIPIQVFIF